MRTALRLTGIRRRSLSSTAGMVLLVIVACGFAALAAISNSPIVIGVFVGAVVGVFLLAVPRLALWLCIVGSLVVSGFVSLFLPSLSKISWLVSMLGFFLLFAGALSALGNPASSRKTPPFVWLALLLLLYALATAPLAGSTPSELMAGAKRYFQLWGILFASAWALRGVDEYRRVVKFLFVLSLAQLPLALYQRIILVPLRYGMGNGVVPIDVVSGTFEASFLGGGNSSGMVLFLTIVLVFTISAWRERMLKGWQCALLSLLLLLPMALGETKVVVVFMPLAFLVIFGRNLRRAPIASITILLAGLGVTALLFWIYGTYFGKTGLSLAQRLEQSIAYNFGNVGYYGAYSLNRTSALTYWWSNHGWANPHELLFGHGLGSSYFAPASLVQGHVARAHGYIGLGLTGASTILWDLGLLGLVLMLAVLWAAWRSAGRLFARAPVGWPRAAIVALQAALLLFGVMLFYGDSVLNALSVQCLLMLCLGGLASATREWGEATVGIAPQQVLVPAARRPAPSAA